MFMYTVQVVIFLMYSFQVVAISFAWILIIIFVICNIFTLVRKFNILVPDAMCSTFLITFLKWAILSNFFSLICFLQELPFGYRLLLLTSTVIVSCHVAHVFVHIYQIQAYNVCCDLFVILWILLRTLECYVLHPCVGSNLTRILHRRLFIKWHQPYLEHEFS